MTMNKQDLVEIMSSQAGISKTAAENALNAFTGSVTNELKRGGEVTLVNFGTLKTGKRAARAGRNPQTGETIQIPAAKTVKFKAGKGLKEAVN